MIARQLITDGIMPLKTSDTGRIALEWMEDFRVMHMPIVNDQIFLGLISEKDIYSLNDFDEALGNHALSLVKPYVFEDQHIYEVLKTMFQNQLSLIPVVNQYEHYLGAITLPTLLSHFASSLSVQEPGAIIVLEMSVNDFVLSEIARIVESNDTKILSLFIHSEKDTMQMQVHLKLNKKDVSALIQTFVRFNYTIMAYFDANDDIDDLRKRYDALMKYLNP
ncbi:MAG: CBS domain-containing protein [Bacteroidales bacterium]|jgi:predicted transcriptional regulator|nr:CBS domain-containing protein [Bacteroidales bacterium]MCK9448295.1 CBS domain-containing protein [Bacteroidales bacterium]MDD3701703.1 CBS domain-containing protein [Bacteroidales bacterium]MDY0369900.1 CBS domain-containing protein [Bacteroidales bacterium]